MIAGDPVADVRGPGVSDQQPRDLAVRAPVTDAVLRFNLESNYTKFSPPDFIKGFFLP